MNATYICGGQGFALLCNQLSKDMTHAEKERLRGLGMSATARWPQTCKWDGEVERQRQKRVRDALLRLGAITQHGASGPFWRSVTAQI